MLFSGVFIADFEYVHAGFVRLKEWLKYCFTVKIDIIF